MGIRSCTLCRKRKLRCNRENPCQNCQRSKTGVCEYNNPPPPRSAPASGSTTSLSQRPRQRRVAPAAVPPSPGSLQAQIQDQVKLGVSGYQHSVSVAGTDADGGSTTPGTSTTLVDSHAAPQAPGIEAMQNKIKALEDQIAQLAASNDHKGSSIEASSGVEILDTGLTDVLCVQHTSSSSGQTRNSTSHKSRWFGQSHWVNGVLLVCDVAVLPYSAAQVNTLCAQ